MVRNAAAGRLPLLLGVLGCQLASLALAQGQTPGRPPSGQTRPAEQRLQPPAGQARPPQQRTQPPPRPRPPDLRLDQRYRHDHYYPPRGYGTPMLPGGSIGLSFGGGNYFFHGGVWFRPTPGRFGYVVVAPPVGIWAPLLPPAYTTLWVGGVPYYYANGVYYAPAAGQGYVVVLPPLGAEYLQPVPPPPAPALPPEPVVYPRNGQSAEQTEADRGECSRWAATLPAALAHATVFQRAMAACMDARGYTVR